MTSLNGRGTSTSSSAATTKVGARIWRRRSPASWASRASIRANTTSGGVGRAACRADGLRRQPGRQCQSETQVLVGVGTHLAQHAGAELEQSAKSRIRPRPGAAKHERRDPIRMAGGNHLRNRPAGGVANQMHPADFQMIHQPQRIAGPLLDAVRRRSGAGADAAMIERHRPEIRRERLNLRLPVRAVTAEPRDKHDRRPCARRLIGQRSAIDRDQRRPSAGSLPARQPRQRHRPCHRCP